MSSTNSSNATKIQIQTLNEGEQDVILNLKRPFKDKGMASIRQRVINLLKFNPTAITTQEEKDQQFQSLQLLLSLELQSYSSNLLRTHKIITNTSPSEVKSYNSEKLETQKEINQTLIEIEELKRELKDEERRRLDKLQYDEISRQILKLGSRDELDSSIHKLQQSISSLTEENSRYSELASSSQQRFQETASNLFQLSLEIGEEVGERKRRDVEKEGEDGDGIDEEENKEVEENEDGSTLPSSDSLNPSASIFKPSEEMEGGRRERDGDPFQIKESNVGSSSSMTPKVAGTKRRQLTHGSSNREEGEASDLEEGEDDGLATSSASSKDVATTEKVQVKEYKTTTAPFRFQGNTTSNYNDGYRSSPNSSLRFGSGGAQIGRNQQTNFRNNSSSFNNAGPSGGNTSGNVNDTLLLPPHKRRK